MRRFFAVLIAAMVLICCGDSEPETGEANDECMKNEEIATDSGLVYIDLKCGKGAEAEGGMALSVHYVGRSEDGTVFDSSRRDEPFRFLLGAGQVIEGWDEGLDGMFVGGERELRIPPELAFGPEGAPPSIPAAETLIFNVELLAVQSPP